MDGGEIMKESQIPVLCVQCQLFLFVRHLVRHFARLSHSVKPKDSGTRLIFVASHDFNQKEATVIVCFPNLVYQGKKKMPGPYEIRFHEFYSHFLCACAGYYLQTTSRSQLGRVKSGCEVARVILKVP